MDLYTELQDIHDIPLPIIKRNNSLGIPTYLFDSPDPQAVQIEIIFLGGRTIEHKKLTAFASHQLIKENKKKVAGKSLYDTLNHCGAQLSLQSFMDGSVISLKSLNRFIPQLLPVICEVILDPNYSTAELNLFREKQMQELAIDKNHGDALAHRLLIEQLFGPNHPYGYSITEPALFNLSIEDLQNHHQQAYTYANCVIIVMAEMPEPILKYLKNSLINHLPQTNNLDFHRDPLEIVQGQDVIHDDRYGPQWAIKMGCLNDDIINNFGSWLIMNNLLGGFYGSRLIKSTREKSGLTYDILSQVETLRYTSFFSIHTEVSPSNKQRLMESIQVEILRLKEDRVSQEELRMVKNYTLGEYLRLLDGPQRQIQTLKSLILEGQDFQDLKKIFDQINRIDPDDLWRDFQSFVNFDDLIKILVR